MLSQSIACMSMERFRSLCAGDAASRQGSSHTAGLIDACSQNHCPSVQAGDEDGWDEALGYMDACGPGWHLQIARTTSDDGLANESLKSLSNCMLSDSTRSVRKHNLLLIGPRAQASSSLLTRSQLWLHSMTVPYMYTHHTGAQVPGLCVASCSNAGL